MPLKASYIPAHRPKLILFVLGIMTLVGVYFLTGLRMDNSLDVWLANEDPKRDFYDEFRKRFGTEEYLLVALCEDDAFSEETMELVRVLSARLADLEELTQVESVWKVYSIWKKTREEGGVEADLATFREDMLTSPFYLSLLLSPTGKDTAIMAQLTERGMDDRQGVADKVRSIVSEIVPHERKVYYAGSSIFNAELNAVSKKSTAIFYPLVALAGRDHVGAGFTLESDDINRLPSRFGLHHLGSRRSGRCGEIHQRGHNRAPRHTARVDRLLFAAFPARIQTAGPLSPRTNGGRSKRLSTWLLCRACFRALTTAVGFGSLVVSRVGPVVELGVFAAISVMGGYVAVVYGLGAMVTILPIPSRWQSLARDGARTGREAEPAPDISVSRSRGTRPDGSSSFLVCSSRRHLVFLPLACISKPIPSSFFPDDNAYSRFHDYLERELFGLSRIQIQVKNKEGEDLTSLGALKKIEEAGEELKKIPNVTNRHHLSRFRQRSPPLAQPRRGGGVPVATPPDAAAPDARRDHG